MSGFTAKNEEKLTTNILKPFTWFTYTVDKSFQHCII